MNYNLMINNRSHTSKVKSKLLQFMMIKLLFAIICCSIIAPGIVFAETIETDASTTEVEYQEYIVKRNNVQDNNVLVKVFGTIDPNAVYSSVILEQIAPNGESIIQNVMTTKDGYYEFYIIHNWYSLRGNYDVTLSLDENKFAATSYEIIQNPTYKSAESIDQEKYYLEHIGSGEDIIESLQSKLIIPKQIPVWMKSTFNWYYMDLISDEEIIHAIQFLAKNDIMRLN